MFDSLLEEDPWVKEKVAEGEAKGMVKGALKEARKMLDLIVQKRYPTLIELAKARAIQSKQPSSLNALSEQLWDAADEQAARRLLEMTPVS